MLKWDNPGILPIYLISCYYEIMATSPLIAVEQKSGTLVPLSHCGGHKNEMPLVYRGRFISGMLDAG
jgi:hypothetical protein